MADPAFSPKLGEKLRNLTNLFEIPEVDGAEAEPDEERDEAGGDLHVVLVSDCQDDDEEEGGAEDLVHGQAQSAHLGYGEVDEREQEKKTKKRNKRRGKRRKRIPE